MTTTASDSVLDPSLDLAARPQTVAEAPADGAAAAAPARPRILCVDDEPHVVEALARLLFDRFEVHTATSGREAIAQLERNGPFTVVVTDMRMPELSGVDVLRVARERAPDTVRILLTGHADVESAVAAVNDGSIFRFLLKPCPPEQLRSALDAAVAQERLVRSERELLEETLKGALKLCMDVLTLVHPQELSRASRVRRIAAMLTDAVPEADRWCVEVAALLAHLGAVTLPSQLLDKLHTGTNLTASEMKMAERLPAVGAQLVSDIPRLEPVRDILLFQRTWFDGTNTPIPGVSGSAIPIGARILLIADDYDVLESRKLSIAARLRVMEGRLGQYDPTLLAALRVALRNVPDTATGDESVVVRLERVRVGMIFAEDVIGPNALTLIGRGQEVTPALVERLRLLAAPIRESPVRMFPGRPD